MVAGFCDAVTKLEGEKVERICNQGKVQRLVVYTLQGRLPGVNGDGRVDAPVAADAPVAIPVERAHTLFFQKPENHTMATKAEFLVTATKFFDDNPSVDRVAFVEGLQDHIRLTFDEPAEVI